MLYLSGGVKTEEELYLGGKMQEKFSKKQERFSDGDVLKRVEILGEAVQTALEALLEIQAEQKLLTYILTKTANSKEE
ncbi:MAG: hypothetical protein OSJ27_03305 [Candidatus Gastranaerophilales bacterium]|nr:hypothetical protein [Candidatus Gastranaerophilales bacterium]